MRPSGGLRVALVRAAGAGSALRLLVLLRRVYEIAFRIAIMVAHPRHGERQAVFVAALGDEIEKVVRPHQNIQSSRIAGIRMKDLARRIPGEDAGSRALFAGELFRGVVVVDLTAGLLLRCEGNVVVEIEIAAEGRDPLK